MTIAIVASLIIQAFTAAVIITFFVLLAEYIEEYAVDKARNTVYQLEKAAPRTALIRRGSAEVEVGVDALSLGDIVIVRHGDRIPADGTVVRGDAVCQSVYDYRRIHTGRETSRGQCLCGECQRVRAFGNTDREGWY